MEYNNLIRKEFELISKNECFVLAVIISSKGSVPRTAGTMMIIERNGSIMGTIGGGFVEADVIKKAELVFNNRASIIIDFNLTPESIGTLDMICGGGIKVLISCIEPTKVNKKIFGTAAKLHEDRKRYIFVSDVTDLKDIKRAVIFSKSCFKGYGFLSEAMIENFWRLDLPFAKQVEIDDKIFLIEPCEQIYSLFIFGAGHVSTRLAKLSSMIGFYTVVIDDRKEFVNKRRFETADELIIVENFKDSFNCLKIDNRSFIAIITRGHLHDKVVLSKALKTDACYIGMIGSKRKRKTIYKKLAEEGFSDEQLGFVSSPIGLEIDADTPEEIAVSIAAELIKIRSGYKKNIKNRFI